MRHFNRAILADIIEKGLDPKVAHGVGSDGRLNAKNAELPSPPTEENDVVSSVEKVVLEENVNKEDNESVQVEAPKKKSNRFKKKSQES